MRLINADKINPRDVIAGNSEFARDTRIAMQNLIDSQPTAYDIDKVVERLQEEAVQAEKDMGMCEKVEEANAFGGKWLAYDNAIKIVQEATVEYNNGWIPCSERLPNASENGFEDFIVMIEGAESATLLTFYERNKEWTDGVGNYYRVIAWQPLPEPYKPNGE